MSDETKPVTATPGDDTLGLILTHLVSREERNTAEAAAIIQAYNKYIFKARKKRRGAGWLTSDFICKVHMEMFGSIWEWAGQYRQDRLNLGVEPGLIREEVKLFCDDFLVWDAQGSTMPVLEIASRLQNRLTKIHPFRNGNGRHARLMTDIFLHSRGYPLPQWPQIHRMEQGSQIREAYIAAMKLADLGDFVPLAQFMEDCLPKDSSAPY